MVITVQDGGLVDVRTGRGIDGDGGSLSQAQRRLQFEDALGVPQLSTLVARDGTVCALADDEVLEIGLSREAEIMLKTLSRMSPSMGELSSQKLAEALYELCCRYASDDAFLRFSSMRPLALRSFLLWACVFWVLSLLVGLIVVGATDAVLATPFVSVVCKLVS
jgi:hypothetical protein